MVLISGAGLPGRRRCAADGMVGTISENDLPYIFDDTVDRTGIVVGDDTQGGMANGPAAGQVQGLVEAILRDLVDMCDVREGHPGVDAAHIA